MRPPPTAERSMTAMRTVPSPNVSNGRMVFQSPLAFYAGCLAVAGGVFLHLPMFFQAASMHYRLAGMPMPPEMIAGMFAIVAGLFLVAYGVRAPIGETASVDDAQWASRWSIRALDDAPFTKEHWVLVVVLGVALVI